MNLQKIAVSVLLLTGFVSANIAQAEMISLPSLELPAVSYANITQDVQALNKQVQDIFARQMKRLMVNSIKRIGDNEFRNYLQHEALGNSKEETANRELAKS